VVAAHVLVDVGRASELAHPHHERRVEQAAFVEIGEQRRQRLLGAREVEGFDDRKHPRVVEAVRVPAALRLTLPADAR
jgi:hypothetical protein